MEVKPDPRLRARRAALVILIWSFFGILGGMSFVTEQVKLRFVPLGLKHFAPITIAWLAISDALRSLPGIAGWVLIAVLASRFLARGGADRHLGKLTVALVVASVLMVLVVATALYLPFVKITPVLSN